MTMPIIDYDYIRYHHRKLLDQTPHATDREHSEILGHWMEDSVVANVLRDLPLNGDCVEFSRACMARARERVNLKARYLLCVLEDGTGHCVCEVSSLDEREAYILDNRQLSLTRYDRLKGYRFLAASPWNPEPGDNRSWIQVP